MAFPPAKRRRDACATRKIGKVTGGTGTVDWGALDHASGETHPAFVFPTYRGWTHLQGRRIAGQNAVDVYLASRYNEQRTRASAEIITPHDNELANFEFTSVELRAGGSLDLGSMHGKNFSITHRRRFPLEIEESFVGNNAVNKLDAVFHRENDTSPKAKRGNMFEWHQKTTLHVRRERDRNLRKALAQISPRPC